MAWRKQYERWRAALPCGANAMGIGLPQGQGLAARDSERHALRHLQSIDDRREA
jgi:hypothetical protein